MQSSEGVLPPGYAALMTMELANGETFASLGCEKNSIGLTDLLMGTGGNVRERLVCWICLPFFFPNGKR